MFKVLTYEVKTGFFGSKIEKADEEMTNFLNTLEKNGWILVTMTEMNTDGRNFVYKMVFRKA